MDSLNRWRTIPRSSMAIFLMAVFLMFSSIGFANDVVEFGIQSPTRFALGVLLSGSFAVCYAATGILLRGRWWKAFIPLFMLHFLTMGWLGHSLPAGSEPSQLGVVQTAQLKGRLVFDGLVIIASICLGYAGFAFVSISEGRRHGRALAEKATLEAEMSAAREVQLVMVPEVVPEIKGYHFESMYRPAAEVGGDFFQVIPLRSGRTLLVIGDVSGKGLRAAMMVSMIVGTLRALSGYTDRPAEILKELNGRLCGRMQDGFATCLVACLDEGGTFAIANAGHLPPYLNGVELKVAGSLPLGLAKDVAYEQVSLPMAIGDVLVMLTDGVAEAQNTERSLLGFERIESLLRSGATARDVAEAARNFGQNDDITVLSMARCG